jgi:uncharacterized protein YukE
MKCKKRFPILAVLLGSVLGLPSVFAQSQAPPQSQDSLADAARKAREQKKPEPKPAKVITNDDLEPGAKPPSATPSPSAAASAAPSSAAEEQTESPAAEEKGEQYWRKKFADTRADLARAEKELDILQREWERDLKQYYLDPQKAMQQQFDRKDLNDHAAQVEAKKKDIEKLKQQLSDLEDELRKSGGDPGWAR